MEDQLISFETAKLAKEKGFNIETEYGYRLSGTLCDGKGFLSNLRKYPAPTQSLLQRWLREVHGLHVNCYLDKIKDIGYYWVDVSKKGIKDYTCLFETDLDQDLTYEQSLEIGLQEALKLIK